MNSATHNDPAFGQGAQRRRYQRADGCEDNRSVQSFRRHFVGTAGPNRAKFFRRLLRCFVARARKHKKFASFIQRNLRDQTRSVTEPVNAKASRIASFAIGTVTDQACAEQRRDLDVIVTLR